MLQKISSAIVQHNIKCASPMCDNIMTYVENKVTKYFKSKVQISHQKVSVISKVMTGFERFEVY